MSYVLLNDVSLPQLKWQQIKTLSLFESQLKRYAHVMNEDTNWQDKAFHTCVTHTEESECNSMSEIGKLYYTTVSSTVACFIYKHCCSSTF